MQICKMYVHICIGLFHALVAVISYKISINYILCIIGVLLIQKFLIVNTNSDKLILFVFKNLLYVKYE